MLKTNAEKLGDVTILHLDGRVTIGLATTILRRSVLSQSDASSIVLDLTKVNCIDARGLGALLELREWAQSLGIGFRITNVSRLVRQLFEMTCLDSVFEISPREGMMSSGAAVLAAGTRDPCRQVVSNVSNAYRRSVQN